MLKCVDRFGGQGAVACNMLCTRPSSLLPSSHPSHHPLQGLTVTLLQHGTSPPQAPDVTSGTLSFMAPVQEAQWCCPQGLPRPAPASQACRHRPSQRGCQGSGEACGAQHC